MYEVGDRVIITSIPTFVKGVPEWSSEMDKWLGKIMTIGKINKAASPPFYLMQEDEKEHSWFDEDIVGIADDVVEVEFDVADSEVLSKFLYT